MQTIKTFVVVTLLIAVCYGAFVALNAPNVSIPEELEQWASSRTEKELSEFEIPSLNFPEPASPPVEATQASGNSTFNGGFAGFSQAAPSNQESLPQFPAFEPSRPTVDPQATQLTPPSSTLLASPDASNGLPALAPPNTNNGTDLGPQGVPPSGAMLTSVPSSVPSDSNQGPSIPFNPNQTDPNLLLNDSDIDDLISAGGPVSENSQLDQNGLPSLVQSDLPKNNSLDNSFGGQSAASSPEQTSSLPKLDGLDSEPTKTLAPFSVARAEALANAQAGRLAVSLETLSQYYESPELSYAEHTDLVDLLDALSKEVIYSDRSLLAPAYTVAAQDTLESLSQKHHIHPELLAAINRMGESQALVASTQIKVLDGPFRAQLSLSRGELTIFLRKMYAGRFPVSISKLNRPAVGAYEIIDRRRDRTFYGANSVVIPASAPTNPYGGYWLDLGSNLSIHGSPEQVTSDLEGAGCISLSPLDASDVYRILSKGSAVEVRQ